MDESLGPGRFGMAEETGVLLNEAIRPVPSAGAGLGQAVRRLPGRAQSTARDRSLAVAAHRLGIPLTVHVAIGTDIIHMHPAASGAAIGETSLRDFRFFTSSRRAARGAAST